MRPSPTHPKSCRDLRYDRSVPSFAQERRPRDAAREISAPWKGPAELAGSVERLELVRLHRCLQEAAAPHKDGRPARVHNAGVKLWKVRSPLY